MTEAIPTQAASDTGASTTPALGQEPTTTTAPPVIVEPQASVTAPPAQGKEHSRTYTEEEMKSKLRGLVTEKEKAVAAMAEMAGQSKKLQESIDKFAGKDEALAKQQSELATTNGRLRAILHGTRELGMAPDVEPSWLPENCCGLDEAGALSEESIAHLAAFLESKPRLKAAAPVGGSPALSTPQPGTGHQMDPQRGWGKLMKNLGGNNK